MAIAAKLTAEREGKKLGEEADCGCDDGPNLKNGKDAVTDPREISTKINLIKNKLRSGLGVKNPIVMVATEEAGDGYIGPARLGLKNPLASDATRASSDKKREAAALAGKKPTEGGLLGRLQQRADAIDATQKMYNHYEPEGEMVDEARAEEKRGLGSTGVQRQRQKKGVVTSYGEVAHPATSYSGGQNPQLRGKAGKTKEQRREASRRYVDQPGGIYAEPENQQGAGRYADKQARKRPDLGSRFD